MSDAAGSGSAVAGGREPAASDAWTSERAPGVGRAPSPAPPPTQETTMSRPTAAPAPRQLTVARAAGYLGTTTSALDELVARRAIPSVRIAERSGSPRTTSTDSSSAPARLRPQHTSPTTRTRAASTAEATQRIAAVAMTRDDARRFSPEVLDDARDPVAGDPAAVLPPVPGSTIDPQAPARLRVRDPTPDQPGVVALLVDHRLTPGRTSRCSLLHGSPRWS
jgi:hypothetical protein